MSRYDKAGSQRTPPGVEKPRPVTTQRLPAHQECRFDFATALQVMRAGGLVSRDGERWLYLLGAGTHEVALYQRDRDGTTAKRWEPTQAEILATDWIGS